MPNELDFYCVTCKVKVFTTEYRIKISDSGRRMAQGMCPQCKKTKINKILGKDNTYYSPQHPVFYKPNLTTEEAKPNNSDDKPNNPQYRVKVTPDGRWSHWWKLEWYDVKKGSYSRIDSGYAMTRWGGRMSVKKSMKSRERRAKEVYLDINYKPL